MSVAGVRDPRVANPCAPVGRVVVALPVEEEAIQHLRHDKELPVRQAPIDRAHVGAVLLRLVRGRRARVASGGEGGAAP